VGAKKYRKKCAGLIQKIGAYPLLERKPELLSWVPLISLQKLPVRFSSEGLRKYPIFWRLLGGF
jgi:hypothetical protein